LLVYEPLIPLILRVEKVEISVGHLRRVVRPERPLKSVVFTRAIFGFNVQPRMLLIVKRLERWAHSEIDLPIECIEYTNSGSHV
jgi:hypothetical protein